MPTTSYRDGARAAGPIAVAVFGFGISYGLLARSAGMGVLAPLVMSATTFAGSAQFAVASILGGDGGVVPAITAAVLLNARYVPIGISIAPFLSGSPPARLVRSQLVVDESWAVANRGGGRFDPRLLLGAGLVLYAGWVSGTAIGLLGGNFLGDPRRLGLDAAFPALFLALVVPQLVTRRALAAAVAGGAIALALVPFAAPGVPIVAAALACLLGVGRR